MNHPSKVVLLSGPEGEHPREEELRFRLTYEGPLQPKQRDAIGSQRDPSAAHTHSIRKVFHKQLKRLWDTNRSLRDAEGWEREFADKGRAPSEWMRISPSREAIRPIREMLPDLYRENGYRFLPLVRENWELFCDLDILFLRNDIPGGLIHAGDIDNRIKTLIDALRKPGNATELKGNEAPEPDEDPFYVLMEDDKSVTSLSVETDTLLQPEQGDQRHVKLVITVTLKPYHATTFNLGFA